MRQIMWLALGYNVPASPSKNRVYVWRKLKEYGAGYFRPGVAILPGSPQSLSQFRALSARIREMGGDCVLAELRYLDADDEAHTVEWFERQSEREYLDIMRECGNLAVTARAKDAGRDEALKKIGKRYAKARSRDFFKSRGHSSVVSELDELLGDMAHVTDDLARRLAKVFAEK